MLISVNSLCLCGGDDMRNYVCVLIACISFIICKSSCADTMTDREQDGFANAPVFAPGSVHRVQTTACAIKTESGFVLDTDKPTIAHCGEHHITITGIAKARKNKDEAETTHVRIALDGGQKKSVAAVMRLIDFPAAFIDSVEFADLNGDSKDDFILNLSSHGNGLAADIGGVLFLLSGTDGYNYLGISEVMKVGSRYVRFGESQFAVLMLQRLVTNKNGSHSVRGLNGKLHTFFIFDLLKFDAATANGVKLNNQLDSRFPYWMLYTNQNAHVETDLLTLSKKQALWRDPLFGSVHGKLVEIHGGG